MDEPVGQKLMRQLMVFPMVALAGGLPIGVMWALSEGGGYEANLTGPTIAFLVAGAGFIVLMLMMAIGVRLYGESWWVSPDWRLHN